MKSIMRYNINNKNNARSLRSLMTDAEQLLWSKIRRKQMRNIQFNRQKNIGNYIVDFYAHAVNLVIEIDGGQHFEDEYLKRDQIRDNYLRSLGLAVLRFNNLQVLKETDAVLNVILINIEQYSKAPRPDRLPPIESAPFAKGAVL